MTSSSTPDDVALAVIIPTSNRAALAMTACRSLLEQRGANHQVLVSDNSTRAEEVQALEAFCRERGDPRLLYIRPPSPLTMPAHWDWAIEQAMARSSATHFTIHYDRKVTKPGHVRLALEAVGRFPGRLMTYSTDHVTDEPPPPTLWQTPWTGRLYEVRTARVLEMTTRGMIDEMGHAFPILSNCIIPRGVLIAIRERFGSICDSTGPDSCFTYRFCALNEHYVHFDRALSVHYAVHRSNGMGYLRHSGGDFGKFMEAWGDRPWLTAAPLPGLNLGQNMLFHEYELVRREMGDGVLPPLDRAACLENLSHGLRFIRDDEARAQVRALLESQGWRPREMEAGRDVAGAARPVEQDPVRRWRLARLTPWRLARWCVYMTRLGYRALRNRPGVVLFLADYLRITPELITSFTFRSDQQAVHYALAYPRRATANNEYLEAMQAIALPEA